MWQMSADSCGCTTASDAPALHNARVLCCVALPVMKKELFDALAEGWNRCHHLRPSTWLTARVTVPE